MCGGIELKNPQSIEATDGHDYYEQKTLIEIGTQTEPIKKNESSSQTEKIHTAECDTQTENIEKPEEALEAKSIEPIKKEAQEAKFYFEGPLKTTKCSWYEDEPEAQSATVVSVIGLKEAKKKPSIDHQSIFLQNPPPKLEESASTNNIKGIITVPKTDKLYLETERSLFFNPKNKTIVELLAVFELKSKKPPLLYLIAPLEEKADGRLNHYRGQLSEFKESTVRAVDKKKYNYYLCTKDITQKSKDVTPIKITNVTSLVNYCVEYFKITPEVFALELEKENEEYINFWNAAIENTLIAKPKEALQSKLSLSKKRRLRKKKNKHKNDEITTTSAFQKNPTAELASEEEFRSCKEESEPESDSLEEA
jgi:hypothetical protein